MYGDFDNRFSQHLKHFSPPDELIELPDFRKPIYEAYDNFQKEILHFQGSYRLQESGFC